MRGVRKTEETVLKKYPVAFLHLQLPRNLQEYLAERNCYL